MTTALQTKYAELKVEEVNVKTARDSVFNKTLEASKYGELGVVTKLIEFNAASTNFTTLSGDSLDKERLEALTTMNNELNAGLMSISELMKPMASHLENFFKVLMQYMTSAMSGAVGGVAPSPPSAATLALHAQLTAIGTTIAGLKVPAITKITEVR